MYGYRPPNKFWAQKPPIIGDGIYFANAFLESIPSTLNYLYKTLTHDMYWSAIKHYEEIFQKIWAPKLPIFDDFATRWQL